ncbi:MAG: class I SAM-dependent methyltransferase [Dehalococcoidia bacterium]|nr:class I SAM-dependent methyltransferase [Dehalococcoidia bacterium]
MKTNKGEDRPASPVESHPADPVSRTRTASGSPSGDSTTILAQDLFDGVAHSYDTWAQVLTFFQYLPWRRFLVSQMALQPGNLVLDVCTGTAGVAMEIADHHNGQIVGLDVSHSMLQAGLSAIEKRSLDGRIQLTQGRAEHLPFPDETFDTVVFTYLLRYVQDPDATVRELSRVLKPGGQLLSLEFGIPETLWVRALWLIYNRVVMPIMTIPVSRGWHRMGCFLGPSIWDFCQRYPVDRIAAIWRDNGIPLVETRPLLKGAAIVMWGTKGR